MFLRPYVKYYHKMRYEEELDLFCSSIRANISIKLHKTIYEINRTLLLRTHVKLMSYIYIHSLATLLGTPCKYWVGPSFAFITALILCGIDSTRGWKHCSEISVHIDMIASRSCCFLNTQISPSGTNNHSTFKVEWFEPHSSPFWCSIWTSASHLHHI